MKKIKDERLKLKNLKNVRIAHFIQTFGIIGILGFDLVTKGIDGLTENPLWIVLLITTMVTLYLSMNISVDHETSTKSPKKSRNKATLILIVISIVIGVLVSVIEGSNVLDGLIIGGVLFLGGLVPIIYLYYIRNKQSKENNI